MFQVIAILALLIPKIWLIGKAIVHAPYCYLWIIFFEFVLISVYNYLIFRSFEFFNCTSTALIVPAFFQTPSNVKTARTTVIWKIRTYLGSYANTPHSAMLYMLCAILIHTPTVVLTQHVSFFNIFAKYFSSLDNLKEEWNYWEILGIYIGGFVAYLPMSLMYYHYGHNWRLLIKTKHAKNSYTNNKIIKTLMQPTSMIPKRTNNNREKAESFELGVEPTIINE